MSAGDIGIDDRIVNARITYDRAQLDEGLLANDPIEQFRVWLDEAIEDGSIPEPNAMALATVDPAGRPSSRIVLLRGYDARGFVFFTNYESEKGGDLAVNPACALLFYWPPLQRQVRIEGRAQRLDAQESDRYFMQRPRGHRLAAWASPQSSPVPDRAYLESKVGEYERRFEGAQVTRPPFWGGFRVTPERFEFWQGRPNRVHDRIVYRPGDGGWILERLAP